MSAGKANATAGSALPSSESHGTCLPLDSAADGVEVVDGELVEDEGVLRFPVATAVEDIVDAEVVEDDALVVTPGTGLMVRQRHEITPAEYLIRPGGVGNGSWGKDVTLAGKVGTSAVRAAGDMWPHLRDGQNIPGWLAGRLARVAKTYISRDRLDPEYVLRCAKGLPVLSKAFEDAWAGRFNDTPPQRVLASAVFEAYDLAVQGKKWGAIVAALEACGRAGTSYVTRAYVDILARDTGRPIERGVAAQTLGSVTKTVQQRLAELDANGRGVA